MPMDYLRSIEHAAFPLRVEDQYAIRCIDVLRAAELVEATIASADSPGSYAFAIVERITPLGRAELGRHAGSSG